MYLNYAEALLHACPTPNSSMAGDGIVHPKSAVALVNEIRNKIKISSRFNLYSYPTSISKADFEKHSSKNVRLSWLSKVIVFSIFAACA